MMRSATPLDIKPMAETFAPFTPQQVDALTVFQKGRVFNPYTCPRCAAALTPSEAGMGCAKCESVVLMKLPTKLLEWAIRTKDYEPGPIPAPARKAKK